VESQGLRDFIVPSSPVAGCAARSLSSASPSSSSAKVDGRRSDAGMTMELACPSKNMYEP